MSDGGWLSAPAGLIRRDGTSKPAYNELLKRVRGEWWNSPTKHVTDEQGTCRFSGFLGDYELEVQGIKKAFSVTEKGACEVKTQIG
jgi:hypothetical protein